MLLCFGFLNKRTLMLPLSDQSYSRTIGYSRGLPPLKRQGSHVREITEVGRVITLGTLTLNKSPSTQSGFLFLLFLFWHELLRLIHSYVLPLFVSNILYRSLFYCGFIRADRCRCRIYFHPTLKVRHFRQCFPNPRQHQSL